MDFKSFFGFKKEMHSKSEEDLDEILKKAANDPAFRPEFYKRFLDFDLYVVGDAVGDHKEEKDGTIIAGDSTSLRINRFSIGGKEKILVFSSLKRLQNCIKGKVNYLQLNGRELLNGVLGDTNVVLNAGAEYGKEFSPAEIREILDGSIFRKATEQIFKAGQAVQLGQPAEPPVKLLNALISYFESKGWVDKAYIAEIIVHGENETAHPVIGLEFSNAGKNMVKELMADIGVIIKETCPPDEVIDITEVRRDHTVGKYMINHVKPFYVK